MSNALYTSYGFGTGEGGHGHFEGREWTKIQREKINEYGSRHNLNLKVISADHKWMYKILSNIEPDRDIHSKNHSVYTLSAIAALLDFCETDHDLFYWLHLDMGIANMDVNVFDTFTIPDDRFYCWAWEDFYLDREWDKIKFNMLDSLTRANDIKIQTTSPKKCNASVFIANKTAALKFKEALSNLDFINKPADPSIGFIEETIVEALGNTNLIDIGDSAIFNDRFANTECRPICFFDKKEKKDPLGAYDKCVFVHFWSEHKSQIPAFYEDRK
jgi:hypothetical protein